MFRPVPPNISFPKLEESAIAFWRERGIYDKSLAARKAQHERGEAKRFVFYEGPPTANGMPHPGHCLTRAIKDLFPRYHTMRGEYCERKAGWDTHGLPVEVEVCKELGIHTKEEIEEYGIEKFIQKCQASVWRYMQEWERLTERIGFWIHLDRAYVTYHQSYVESVWWSLANLFDRGLLYQGHKIVWWWAQGGTALSSGEVGQGYRQVADPSVYVKFPLLDENGTATDESLLVWTTTPWTLPSNQFAAVDPELEYSIVSDGVGGRLVIASALVETIALKVKSELAVERTLKGSELVGRRYLPPFGCLEPWWNDLGYLKEEDGDVPGEKRKWVREYLHWRVVGANFVTVDSGTGVVHIAPAHGESDYQVFVSEYGRFTYHDPHFLPTGPVGISNMPRVIILVGPDGKFLDQAGPDLAGKWVKDCDKDIIRDLKRQNLLVHQEQYLHDYPFCWRAEQDPLIQIPRKSWFIKTTAFKDDMLANNAKINWLPEHIRDGRFGNFLESNVDWALSRERYWGTPLPIWVCDATGKMEAVSSYDELLAKPGAAGTDVWDAAKKLNPAMPDDLRVHKPYIDAITYTSPFAEKATMRRVTEVIDCWYDSGAMPFAQWGYRGENGPAEAKARFHEQFPADFISEALDQTRGWFYSQLAISTMVFGEESGGRGQGSGDATGSSSPTPDPRSPHPFPHPFRNCIVLGLMLGEDGQKMSKSKRNYREPNEIFEKYGADALRWYFFANQPPWTSIRYSEQAIKDSVPEFLLRLWNCYSFFVIYANIDGFDPADKIAGDAGQLNSSVLNKAAGYRPLAARREIDRWIISELNRTAKQVVASMDAYDNYTACQRITEYVDALSNWYVRRTRDRFWGEDKTTPDKLDAYWTLYECLVTTSKLVAPFVPFLAESMWQNLVSDIFGSRAAESVHLCDYPTGDDAAIDELLSAQMALAREIASLGRAARTAAKIKVRQPLAKVEIVLAHESQLDWLTRHDAAVRDELNVKEVEYTTHGEEYITYEVLPNFKRLGPRVGKLLPGVKAALSMADGAKLLADLSANGKIELEVGPERIVLDGEDIQVRLQAKPGWAAAQGKQCVVVLNTELTESLILEGVAKDLVRIIQDQRKAMNCAYTDRIRVGVETQGENLIKAIEQFGEYIRGETLAVEITVSSFMEDATVEATIGEEAARVRVTREV